MLGFDDIGEYGFVPANYGGLDWSATGWIAFGDPQAPYTAHSGDWRISTDFGSSDAASTIRFTMPSVFEGAWFSGYGDATVTFELYAGGNLVATSATLAPGEAPAFLASGYAGLVDAVVVTSPLQAFYAMDDFSFSTVTAPVPEPQSWALLAGGLGVVGRSRTAVVVAPDAATRQPHDTTRRTTMTTDPNRRGFLRAVGTAAGATAAMTTFPPAIARALSIRAARPHRHDPGRRAHRDPDAGESIVRPLLRYAERRARFRRPLPDPGGRCAGHHRQERLVPAEPERHRHAGGGRAVPAEHGAAVRGDARAGHAAQLDRRASRLGPRPHERLAARQAEPFARLLREDDLPFQWAMANAFTVCDAYHCAAQTGTNTNRLFIWTGTNDPLAKGNGPATYNDYDWFDANPGNDGGYSWTTYPERLQAAGISWQVYENMADNYTDNPLAGFKNFRAAWFQTPGYSQALRDRGVSTRDLDLLKADVLANQLPSVSWIVAPSADSEHPSPSSPAQGADYTARVLDALTANPEVWARTVFIVNFDENDGFFDHLPPPAAPSYKTWNADPAQAELAGGSTVDTTGEYHEVLVSYHNTAAEQALLHRPYGMGPRVPMYILSPWSRGGWVNSQVFDHTSVIRFIEARFGVMEPNISAWRRAVSGDLTTAFNFADPNDEAFFSNLPATLALANKSRALPGRTTPALPAVTTLPVQSDGVRPSRALPYDLVVVSKVAVGGSGLAAARVSLQFGNSGKQAGVFHVYDRRNLADLPRRYTVEPGKQLSGSWAPAATGAYDLWVLGPNGFHRHCTGNALRAAAAAQPNPEVQVSCDTVTNELVVKFVNSGGGPCIFTLTPNQYYTGAAQYTVVARGENVIRLPLSSSGGWYDFSVGVRGQADYSRRFAGRLETGTHSFSDPAMFGPALGDQWRVG